MKFDFNINENNYYSIVDYKEIPRMRLQTKAVYIAEIDHILETEFGYIEPEFVSIAKDVKKGKRYDFYDTLVRFRNAIVSSMINSI